MLKSSIILHLYLDSTSFYICPMCVNRNMHRMIGMVAMMLIYVYKGDLVGQLV